MHKKHGRREPYTEAGVRRLPCYRCGAKPSTQQWSVCSAGNLQHPLCVSCDVELNELVLRFMGVPNRTALMRRYRKRMKERYG